MRDVTCPICKTKIKENNFEEHMRTYHSAAKPPPSRKPLERSHMPGRCIMCGAPAIPGDSVCYNCNP